MCMCVCLGCPNPSHEDTISYLSYKKTIFKLQEADSLLRMVRSPITFVSSQPKYPPPKTKNNARLARGDNGKWLAVATSQAERGEFTLK